MRICKTVVITCILWIELITFHVVARNGQNEKKVNLSVSTNYDGDYVSMQCFVFFLIDYAIKEQAQEQLSASVQ